ncbi:MAG: hypothetical protein ACHQYP_11000 [Nitrospiria bacterium]
MEFKKMDVLIKKCLHEMQKEWCSICTKNDLEKPLKLKFAIYKSGKNIGVVLDEQDVSSVKLFISDEGYGRITFEEKQNLNFVGEAYQDEVIGLYFRVDFLNAALAAGHLFEPPGFLEARETSSYGPPNCWSCRRIIGFAQETLGCRRCRFYACHCGSCLCDFPGGLSYKGNFIRPGKGLPCEKNDRKIFVKIAQAIRKRV